MKLSEIQLDTLMNKRNEIFIPLLKEYTKNNYDSIIRSKYPWAPFIPYSFAEYGNSKPSVFYIGIDTLGWGTKPEDLIMAYNSNDYSLLFSKNDNVVTPERILKKWSYSKGPFWEFLCKMQLFFKDQRLRSTSDLRSLSIEEQKSIYEIGYGNANLLELPKTLEKEEYWESIDKEDYWRMIEGVKSIFSPIKNILDSFKPDIIIVLGADISDEYLFKDLNYCHHKDFDEGKWRKLYSVENYDVKVIKTYHPNAFWRQRSNNDEMVEYLYESLKLFES